ncbi:hypothetical protein PTKU15_56260 [Paraburkholderia terrae]|nr:hypothetical protein PTKU15_56260 [Paraburkholderia terrae]
MLFFARDVPLRLLVLAIVFPINGDPPAMPALRSERTGTTSIMSEKRGLLYSFTPPASGAFDDPGATSPTPNSSSRPQ